MALRNKKKQVELNDGTKVDADQIQHVAEGETAQSQAVASATANADALVDQIDPIKAGIIDRAFQFMAKNEELFKAVASHGPENLAKVVVTVAKSDIDSGIRIVKYLMRQLTNDLHFRYSGAYRQQQMAAQRMGGGVNGIEINAAELLSSDDWYAGSPDDACTPSEQANAVQDLHALLSGLYTTLNDVKYSWLAGYQSEDLPYFWYVDQSTNEYKEIHDLYAAFVYLDERQQNRQADRMARQRSALDALASMKIA